MRLSTIVAVCIALLGLITDGRAQAGQEMLLAAREIPSAPKKSAGNDIKQIGDRYARQGNRESAMAAYREFMEKHGNDTAAARIARALGEYYYADKNYPETIRYFSMVKGPLAAEVPHRLMLARSLNAAGKNKEAIELLQPLAILTTLTIDERQFIFKTLGEACLATGQNDKAFTWYEKYQKLGGAKNADVSYGLAFLQETANPIKAKLQYEENVKKFPADYRNFLRLGLLHSSNKATLKQSAALLKKAAELGDTIPSAWLEVARAYGRLGRTDDELSAYEQYRKFDTASLEARTRIGTIILAKGYTDEAMRMLTAAHKQAPDSTGPRVALADAYLRTGKTSEAINLLVKAKASKPKDPEIRRMLVEAYRITKQDQQAFQEIKALLEIKRDNPLLLSYARLLLKLGKLDEAANAIEDIRATEPENIEALMTLGAVLRAQKKQDEAIEIYKEISAIDFKYAPATYERAQVYLEQKKIKWAEQFYKRALEQDPGMAVANLGLARVALQYKNRDVYLEFLDKAAAMDPGHPEIKKELKKSRETK
ncbi:MAG: tetratricopeptide repeat protein [Chitinispirillaceae bacterium]|nr:tetratricopeptide repeat protein [Chitinispirillaceae bacterium]